MTAPLTDVMRVV